MNDIINLFVIAWLVRFCYFITNISSGINQEKIIQKTELQEDRNLPLP